MGVFEAVGVGGGELWQIDKADPGRTAGGYGLVGTFPSALTIPGGTALQVGDAAPRVGLSSGTIAIGSPNAVTDNSMHWSNILPRPLIPAELVAGRGSAYVTTAEINPGLNVIRLSTVLTATDSTGGVAGPDLISAWENGGTLTFRAGSAEFVFDVDADNLAAPDASEPYGWSFGSAARTRAAAYCAAVNDLDASQRATTLTLEV